jgi:hypothetical protein
MKGSEGNGFMDGSSSKEMELALKLLLALF